MAITSKVSRRGKVKNTHVRLESRCHLPAVCTLHSAGSHGNCDRTDSHHNRQGSGQQDPDHSDPADERYHSNEEEKARTIDKRMPRPDGSWLELG